MYIIVLFCYIVACTITKYSVQKEISYIMGLSNTCHLMIHPESSEKTHFIMYSFSESKDS